jgi:hypothetical protein
VPKPIATWNPARGVWETDQVNLLCGHSEPYSETWPTSGTTRNGVAYEQPTWEPRTVFIVAHPRFRIRRRRGGRHSGRFLHPLTKWARVHGGRGNRMRHAGIVPEIGASNWENGPGKQ